jgi:hypothetical protein
MRAKLWNVEDKNDTAAGCLPLDIAIIPHLF